MKISTLRFWALLVLAVTAHTGMAHITLPPGGATAGTVYPAAFRVGHACKDAAATTAVKVRIPAGFTPLEARPRPGWTVSVTPQEVSWTANSAQAALPAKDRTSFVVSGKLAETTGVLWFKVLQVCDNGSADWAQVPARDGDKPEFPAARLDVLAPGQAPVDVREAWVRTTVPGQSATGLFGAFTAGAGSRLVGGSSPLAASVEVHEMKMDGNVMRMRALDQGLELPPGEAVALRPGGYHIMLMGLKQALPQGSTFPLVLNFVDREGRRGELKLQVPVKMNVTTGDAMPHHH